MPLYEYAPDSGSCEVCRGRFEVLQTMDAPPLAQCPQCGAACHRVLSTFAPQSGKSHLLSPQNLAAKGFTQYRKAGDGVYEKTAGSGGPDVLRRPPDAG
jgi:putative FmdB family regulatory protein